MSFFNLSPIARTTIGLVGLLTSVVLFASMLGLVPDIETRVVKERNEYCAATAHGFSTLANQVDAASMDRYLHQVMDRVENLKSIGVRASDGEPMIEVGEHFANWSNDSEEQSSDTDIKVPVYANDEIWSFVEMRFEPIRSDGWAGFLERGDVQLTLFIVCASFFSFYFYLRMVLKQLSPSKAIPNRVRNAFDTLAEGLAIIDKQQRIVLANKALENAVGASVELLVGHPIDDLGIRFDDNDTNRITPWREAYETEQAITGRLVTIETPAGEEVVFSVSCGPILDPNNQLQGVMVSFEDVTPLEKKKEQLERMLFELDESAEEIKRQNQELAFLATRDPLTGVMNRRSCFERFDVFFEEAINEGKSLSAFMVDIDHFKSINDNHGHATGDEVLKQVARTLEEYSRSRDIVCRYGGEEFCVLLPSTTIEEAAEVAERMRRAIEVLEPAGLTITASLGVSATCQGPESPQDLLEHADKCLYVAKRGGRNQVVRWDQTPHDVEVDESKISRTKEAEDKKDYSTQIPFHAVTALISTLTYRDQVTANHCRRVADLAVAVGEGLLSTKSCYVLEIAGLLHDIGKIGVPDTILQKRGTLTSDDLKLLRKHERFGREIINTSFGCSEIDEILANFEIDHSFREIVKREISTAARILKVVDAYDTLTHDDMHCKAMSQWDAFKELRIQAGETLDSELVDRVINLVKIRNKSQQLEVMATKPTALRIGLQLERLAKALDERDKKGIATIASRIEESANLDGASAIADKAKELSEEISDRGDLYEIIRGTTELMDLCRSAQRVLLDRGSTEDEGMQNARIDSI